MPHPLDEATRLEPIAEGRYGGATHPAYANIVGPFGGATAATLINAVMLDPRRLGDPIALTVNFCARIADGAFEIAAKLQRGGRTTQHWSMELTQGGEVSATASAVCGARKPCGPIIPSKAPRSAAGNAGGNVSAGRPAWTKSYSVRFAEAVSTIFRAATG